MNTCEKCDPQNPCEKTNFHMVLVRSSVHMRKIIKIPMHMMRSRAHSTICRWVIAIAGLHACVEIINPTHQHAMEDWGNVAVARCRIKLWHSSIPRSIDQVTTKRKLTVSSAGMHSQRIVASIYIHSLHGACTTICR